MTEKSGLLRETSVSQNHGHKVDMSSESLMGLDRITSCKLLLACRQVLNERHQD